MLNDSLNKNLVLGILFLSSNCVSAANTDTPSNGPEQMSRQIFMLEKALAPTNPKQLAVRWAEAVKNRNGAVQYMLQCPELQKTNLNNFIELNWVTGVSSPWVASYKITPASPENNIWNFTIQYKLAASDVINWSNIDKITVVPVSNDANSSQSWCVSQLKKSSPKTNE